MKRANKLTRKHISSINHQPGHCIETVYHKQKIIIVVPNNNRKHNKNRMETAINLRKQNKVLLLKNLHKFYNRIDLPWVQLVWNSYCHNEVPHMVHKGARRHLGSRLRRRRGGSRAGGGGEGGVEQEVAEARGEQSKRVEGEGRGGSLGNALRISVFPRRPHTVGPAQQTHFSHASPALNKEQSLSSASSTPHTRCRLPPLRRCDGDGEI